MSKLKQNLANVDQDTPFENVDQEKTGKKIIFLIGLLAFLLPSLIYGISVIRGYEIQSSISHNYFTNLREIFTGILFSIGLMMICYTTLPDSNKKKRCREILYSKIAAVCSILIAIFPASPHKNFDKFEIDKLQYTFNGTYNFVNNVIHSGSAFILFIILSLFCFDIFRKKDNLNKLNSIYFFFGSLILIGIFIALIGVRNQNTEITSHFILIGETIALFSFGISWMIKGKEDKIFVENKIL